MSAKLHLYQVLFLHRGMLVLSSKPFEYLLSRIYLSNFYWAGAIKSQLVSINNLTSYHPVVSYFPIRNLNPNANQVQKNENN